MPSAKLYTYPSSASIRFRAIPREAGLLERSLPGLLFVLFLLYTFVTTSPLAEVGVEGRAEGRPIDRLAIFGLAGLAAVVIALRPWTTLALLRKTTAVWVLMAWFLLSTAWSSAPDLTLRRSFSLILITITCLGIASGAPSLRRVHALLFGVLALVVAANLLATVVRPDFAFTDIGVRGFYAQKNQAGLVAMLTAIVALCWTVGQRKPVALAAGLLAALLSAVLLRLSDSKTSFNLAMLAGLSIPALLFLRRLGPAWAVLLGGAAVAAVALLLLLLLGSAVDPLAFAADGGDLTFTGRAQIWDFIHGEIARRPWTGFGYGGFWDVGEDADPLLRAPPGSWLSQVATGVINQAHNGYLDLWVQAGLPALILGIAIPVRSLWRFVVRFFAGWRSRHDPDRDAALAGLLVLLVFFIHNATESSLWERGQMFCNLSILLVFLAERFATESTADDRRTHDDP